MTLRFRWRVLAHGLGVMLLLSVAITLADRVFVTRWVERELTERRARTANQISVYGPDRALIASNVEPPVGPPAEEIWVSLSDRRQSFENGGSVVSAMYRENAFAGVVVRRLPPPLERYPGPPLAVLLLVLVACVLVTLVVSIPLARSVVQPVETLARAVKQFGSGQLSARASVKRDDEIGVLAAGFNEMAGRIESLIRSEKQLLANVSHELRTPLARIRVVLELASDGEDARVRSYLPEIAHDLAELETLVDDVLASARRESESDQVLGAGRVPLRWTTVSVGALVEKSRSRFASMYPDGTLEVAQSTDLPELRCDPVLLRRVVDNLLDNAVKHGKGAPVELAVGSTLDTVWIRVSDRGPGMAPEVAAHAFDPFYRADASRDRRNGGVGLGLSIVRGIVEAHGGTVELETSPGEGAAVTARIPRRPAG